MRSASDEAATELLLELVGTPSVSGDEAGAVGVFVRWARRLGFEAGVDEAGNGIATRTAPGGGRRPTSQIVLLGHIDTVPGEIPVRVEDGVLHGRGSVDAKGPLAALLVGAARAEIGPGTSLVVAAAVGEETAGSPGARHLASRLHPDACVVGEPSGADGVTLGYKGRLIAHAECAVESAHSAGPDGSAADRLLEWWAGVSAHAARVNAGAGREFDRLRVSAGSMSSEHTGLADRASLSLGFRLPPSIAPAALESELIGCAPGGVTVRFEGRERAHETTRNDPVVRAISGAIRARGARPRPKLKTGTADLNVVAPVWRCPIAAYGPGDSSLDHTPHERLSLSEFHRSIGVVASALPALAGSLDRSPAVASSAG